MINDEGPSQHGTLVRRIYPRCIPIHRDRDRVRLGALHRAPAPPECRTRVPDTHRPFDGRVVPRR